VPFCADVLANSAAAPRGCINETWGCPANRRFDGKQAGRKPFPCCSERFS
jgi:hypothetical protein